MIWPWSRRQDDDEVRGVVATNAVKTEALTLVGDLRNTLRNLERVLAAEADLDETEGVKGDEE